MFGEDEVGKSESASIKTWWLIQWKFKKNLKCFLCATETLQLCKWQKTLSIHILLWVKCTTSLWAQTTQINFQAQISWAVILTCIPLGLRGLPSIFIISTCHICLRLVPLCVWFGFPYWLEGIASFLPVPSVPFSALHNVDSWWFQSCRMTNSKVRTWYWKAPLFLTSQVFFDEEDHPLMSHAALSSFLPPFRLTPGKKYGRRKEKLPSFPFP